MNLYMLENVTILILISCIYNLNIDIKCNFLFILSFNQI